MLSGAVVVQIVLWASLGDSELGVKCSDYLTTGGDNEDFLILWKVTACLYFVVSIIFIALLALGIMAMLAGGGTHGSSHSVQM